MSRQRAKRSFGNVYESRGVWYVRYSVAGVRHHVRGGDDRKAAEAVLARLTLDRARDVLEGRAVGGAQTLADFAPRVWSVWEATLRAATIVTRRKVVRHYAAVLTRPMRDLTAPEAEAVLLGRLRSGLKVSSVHHDKRVLSSLWTLAARMEVIPPKNPWKAVRLPKIEREAHRRCTEAELTALYDAAADDLVVPFLLMGEAGLRRGEVLGLRWGDVAKARDAVTVRAAVAKSHESRTVPIVSSRLVTALTKAGGSVLPSAVVCPINASRLNHGFRAAAIALGIPEVHPHSLRHTYAHRLAEAGVSLYVLRDLLGHASVTQTEVYASRAREDTLRAGVLHAESLRISTQRKTSDPSTK